MDFIEIPYLLFSRSRHFGIVFLLSKLKLSIKILNWFLFSSFSIASFFVFDILILKSELAVHVQQSYYITFLVVLKTNSFLLVEISFKKFFHKIIVAFVNVHFGPQINFIEIKILENRIQWIKNEKHRYLWIKCSEYMNKLSLTFHRQFFKRKNMKKRFKKVRHLHPVWWMMNSLENFAASCCLLNFRRNSQCHGFNSHKTSALINGHMHLALLLPRWHFSRF